MSLDAGTWFVVCAAVVAALVPGYVLWLRIGRRPTASDASPHGPLPRVDVVVAVRDEAAWIEDKIRDLAALDAPDGGLAFWIADGASQDGTAARAERLVEGDPRFHVLRTPHRRKTEQLNAVLARCDADWVLMTDADALLPRDAVVEMLRVAARDGGVGVVGTYVEPADAHPVERMHWRSLNALCRAEARRGSAAIVTGPCMLFRREVLRDGFPEGVVADDVHVAFAAAAAGFRVAFADLTVRELRAPRTIAALVRHKLRKGDAYLREIVRFAPRARRFPAPARGVFVWRALQATLFPFAALGAAASAVAWTIAAPPSDVLVAAAAVGAVVAADVVVAAVRRESPRVVSSALLGALLAATLLAAIVVRPFARGIVAYRKVPAPRRSPSSRAAPQATAAR